jgi:hypothetical protein
MSNITKKTPYTGKKLKAALMMAEGLKSQRDISDELDIHESTISKWKQNPDFTAYVDKMTVEHETASRAGLLRRAYAGVHLKQLKAGDDRSTHLDYLKFIAELQGLKDDKTNNSKDANRITKIQICRAERDENPEDVQICLPDNGRDPIPKHNNNPQ